MRIVFFGSPDYAVPSLHACLALPGADVLQRARREPASARPKPKASSPSAPVAGSGTVEQITERFAAMLEPGLVDHVALQLPTGDMTFDEAYRDNCLVNAMCVGLLREQDLIRAKAEGVGNPIIAVGARTGRDGIHGATMASAEFDDKSAEKRPAVQVGDPFMEKLLLEACLEVMRSDALVGIQDMGAAGLSCATSEMGSRGGVGIEIDVSLVPQRETGMTPYEIMLSESQERMLMVVKQGREADVERIFEKWDLHAVRVGSVTADDRVA